MYVGYFRKRRETCQARPLKTPTDAFSFSSWHLVLLIIIRRRLLSATHSPSCLDWRIDQHHKARNATGELVTTLEYFPMAPPDPPSITTSTSSRPRCHGFQSARSYPSNPELGLVQAHVRKLAKPTSLRRAGRRLTIKPNTVKVLIRAPIGRVLAMHML